MLKYLMVSKSPAGEISVFDDRDNFLAAFKDNRWMLGGCFQDWDLQENFILVQDDAESLKILDDARAALNKPLKQARAG